jgi:hypothetical protein
MADLALTFTPTELQNLRVCQYVSGRLARSPFRCVPTNSPRISIAVGLVVHMIS